MTRHPFLESFDRGADAASVDGVASEVLEQARTEAFEAGYASGWEDAVASDKTSKQRVDAEFERNMQNLTLTFSDAVAHVREELEGFVDALINHLLPAILPDILREHVRAEILRLGDSVMDSPVQIVASRDSMPLLADMLEAGPEQPVDLIEDSSLAQGQVHVRLGSCEREVNLGPAIAALAAQFEALRRAPEAERTANV